jgi:PIN domain nuclease of toxin-antitoxin system
LRLLLDTHIAYWLIGDTRSLNQAESDILRRADVEIALTAVALWELRLKWQALYRSGDRKGPINPKEALAAFHKLGLPILPLDADIAATPLLHPIVHKDPFDDLLLVQAQQLGMKLFTRDEKLVGHPLAFFA